MSNLQIRKIDINNFGCYKDYKQHGKTDNPGIGKDFKEENVNIFYGRNYSGKSTYSKIFQSIELKKLPENYDNIDYEIKLANNSIIKSSDIENKPLPIDCKVFNQQFVNDNLQLHTDNKINSFQISVGTDTNKILQKIKKIQLDELNPKNEELLKIEESLTDAISKLDIKQKKFDSHLRRIASNIRNQKNPSVITGKRYDINDLKYEFKNSSSHFPIIPSEDSIEYKELNRKLEQAKSKILENNIEKPQKINILDSISNFNFNSFLVETKNLLSKVVKVSNILDEYKNDPDKINWIKQGIEIHGETPETCIFCGNTINKTLIINLTLAFSEELKLLEAELENKKAILEIQIKRLLSIKTINKDEYFKHFSEDIENINKDIKTNINNNVNTLKNIQLQIINKQRDIFSKILIENLTWKDFSGIQKEIDILYNKTIAEIEQFDNIKLECMSFIRRVNITKELSVVEFNNLSEEIQHLQNTINILKNSKGIKESIINEIQEKIKILENSLKSETEAINRINTILYNSLFHSEISLKSIDDNKGIYFEVHRNNKKAYNLSEGEKSLIAFSYYIAKLETLTIEEKKKTILFIDDPISSLDENNIFYIYNIIFCLLDKKEFLQYFLSTHNLDFLKYTNRFSSKKDYYLIEKIKTAEDIPAKSHIVPLPKHLSMKVTEFVFLFEQIYRVATEEENENNFHIFYNFPNNARKFIETLLYFKYPDYKTNNDTKINKYFGEDIFPFIQRINNEYSHGEDRFDRTRNPINTSEFKHDAKIILTTIYSNDIEQFTSFLNNSNLSLPDFINNK